MLVKQILSALDLLEYFAKTKRPASLTEIHQHFGWPRSSAYNVLSTLVQRGYMYEPTQRGAYYPTPRLLQVASAVTDADELSEPLSTILETLASDIGETVLLAAPAGRHCVYLNVIEAASPVRYACHVGVRIPIHAGASGRALLSLYSPSERRSVLRKIEFEPYGSNALMSEEAVEQEIAASIKRGWFQSLREYDADLAAIALPLRVDDRRLAIVVAGPVFRLGKRLREVATKMRQLIDDEITQTTSHNVEFV